MNRTIGTILVFVITACTTPFPSTSIPSSDDDGLCEWFNESLVVRTERTPAIIIVQDVTDKYSGVEFSFDNTAMMNDYIDAIEEYIAVNEHFIDEWNRLGDHPSAREYWENELKAVETYNEGYSLSLRGFRERQGNLIQQGSEIYETGNIASNKAEDLMIDLRMRCR